jgi:hypothetical protein
MSTLDKCERCPAIYQVSGFYVGEENMPEDLKKLMSITAEQWKVLDTLVPRHGYLCPDCLIEVLTPLLPGLQGP